MNNFIAQSFYKVKQASVEYEPKAVIYHYAFDVFLHRQSAKCPDVFKIVSKFFKCVEFIELCVDLCGRKSTTAIGKAYYEVYYHTYISAFEVTGYFIFVNARAFQRIFAKVGKDREPFFYSEH